jgi:glycerol uptake facilitator-like aquaporin
MTRGRRFVAEALGTGFLVAAVVGSGIMADRLAGDPALALLCNTLPTGAILVVLVTILAPVSGAHLNPVVTMVLALDRRLPSSEVASYILAQLIGGIAGTAAAHLMFTEAVLQASSTARAGASLWLAEGIAAFGLVSVILAGARFDSRALPWLVGLYITSAYWFTASTSFANPAATIARSLTDSFSGIRPLDVPAFVIAQTLGALAALALMRWLLATGPTSAAAPRPR